MPSFAAAFAQIADTDADAVDAETSLREAFDDVALRQARPLFGAAHLLSKLVRLTRAANEDRAEPLEPVHRSAPNHCEFDYDYYVALQSRRRHQPSRLNHRDRLDARH